MSKKGYKITRSNYTVRKKHKKLSDGSTVYERDFMATTNLGGFESSTIPNSESNFKFVYNSREDKTRSHKYGEWLTPINNEGREYWTVSDIETDVSESVDTKKVVIRPNYNSLLDFAYFGNCTELIRASITDIIKKFPGELYVSDTIVGTCGKEWGPESFRGKTLYLVENPFGLDIISNSVPNNEIEYNELRYFCASADKYSVLDESEESLTCVNGWEVTYWDKPLYCLGNGELGSYTQLATISGETFYIGQYNFNGKIVLVTTEKYIGWHVRPTESYYDEFYEQCDDFEKLMLNNDNSPKYTMVLDTPEETEDGVISYRRKYTWPTSGGWNLDIESPYYENYIKLLTNISTFYDEYYTNNLWRMLTHDSVKNLDKTFTRDNSDETSDDIIEGVGRMEGFLLSCARLFDDLIRYTNSINSVNEITYNQNNNIPNYFLSDDLENKGWEVYSPITTLGTVTTEILYSGNTKHYTKNDASNIFLRNLSLCSKDILKKKGTRRCIEEVLGLFGLISYDMVENKSTATTSDYDYKISEHVYVATHKDNIIGGVDYNNGLMKAVKVSEVYQESGDTAPMEVETELEIEKYNRLKINNTGDEDEPLKGLPCTYVYFIYSGETYEYVIPWVENVEEIDGVPYFQLYGGWGKRNRLNNINLPSGFTVFSETERYLPIVKNIGELSEKTSIELTDNEIYYVYDISDISDYYDLESGETEDVSHYFIIKNRFNSYYYSDENTEVEDGWWNIKLSDINSGSPSDNAVRVIYLNSIIDEARGNNPHTGRGKYDYGKSFEEYFSQLFKYSIENDNFTDDAYDCQNGTIKGEILKEGFKIEEQKDNNKVWYFTEMESDDDGKSVYALTRVTKNTYTQNSTKTFTKVGISGETFFNSELLPVDPENSITKHKHTINSKGAAYSVINNKHLTIDFCGNYCAMSGFENYLNKCIIPYLYQVIPSTTLLEIKLSGLECTTVERDDIKTAEIVGISEDNEKQYEYVETTKAESETWIELENESEIPFPNASAYRFIKIGDKYYKLIKKT